MKLRMEYYALNHIEMSIKGIRKHNDIYLN